MRRKRLFAFLLIIAMSATFTALQVNSAITASAQDAKVKKQDGFISGCSVIDPLDDCVQARFAKVDKGFGMVRMLPTTVHLNHFRPENKAEGDAVEELKQGGWDVGFYLAGRKILDSKADEFQPFRIGKHPVIGGPVLITSDDEMSWKKEQATVDRLKLPAPSELFDEAQKAMRAFDSKNRYEFSIGKWSIEARPIRAAESCLRCHHNNTETTPDNEPRQIDVRSMYDGLARSKTPIKVGDALGVAMYAYARKQ